ncbi:MAG: lamin tail domain-containing protein [Anaerolineales bacterium]
MPMLAPARAAPQMQELTNVVISEFRVRGSAGVDDEFIEIYNPLTNGIVDLNGWKIQRSNATGVIADLHLFTVSIPLSPGQHYLVAHVNYNDAVSPDATYSTGNTGIVNSGGIALIRPNSSIADQAGLTSCGSCFFETTPLTSFGTTNVDQSYERVYDPSFICVDSNNNSANFALRNPSDPQNSSSLIVTCGDPNPFLTSTAASNETATAASYLTGTAASNQTGTAAINQTGTAAVNQTGSAVIPSTVTRTPTITLTPTPVGFLSVVINEIAWAGTAASSSDEWIELYNSGSNSINLAGWSLRAVDGTPTINLIGVIPAGGYYLLERIDNNTVSDVAADQTYTGALANSSETLQLFESNRLIDTAKAKSDGNWPAGSAFTFSSMERRAVVPDSDTAWFTFAGTPFAHDRNNNLIRGTPGRANWAFTVTATASPTPSRTRTPTVRPTQTRPPTVPPQPLVAINEFVPRPGNDWNNDGVVNVGDEYVELINHGIIDVSLSGYSLDDEVNIGSNPYQLPAITISPGERIVFYGTETGLLLSDGGDGVRLLSPNGQLKDAYNYRLVRFPDQSFCRLPDNGGLDDWNTNCFPTPGLQNALSGSFVSPPNVVDIDLLCPIADTLPLDFILAECPPFGNNIWRPAYWDDEGWYGEKYLPKSPGKWPVFAD